MGERSRAVWVTGLSVTAFVITLVVNHNVGTPSLALDLAVATPITLLVAILSLQIADVGGRERDAKRIAEVIPFALALRESPVKESLAVVVRSAAELRRQNNDIYLSFVAEDLQKMAERMKGLADGYLRVVGTEAVKEFASSLLRFLASGRSGFATLLLEDLYREDANGVRPSYHRENVEAARRGCAITRVLLIDSRKKLFATQSEALLSALFEEASAQIDVRFVDTDELPDSARRDFGIWDDEVVCYIEKDATGELQAHYYADARHIEEAKMLRSEILGTQTDSIFTLRDDDRLLLYRSARKMAQLAPTHCKRTPAYFTDPVSPCTWYHGSWQYLRSLDLVENPTLFGTFFSKAVTPIAASPQSHRILISGLADYQMLAEVLAGLENANTAHEIHVIDVCETPLEISRWYLENRPPTTPHRVHFSPHLAEQTNFDDEFFDLIVTDAFLTKLGSEHHPDLVREWSRVLKSSGRIVTSAKLALSGEHVARATDQQIEAYADIARERARALIRAEIDADLAGERAEEYALQNVSYPLSSTEDIEALFRTAGLTARVGHRIACQEYAPTAYVEIEALKQ